MQTTLLVSLLVVLLAFVILVFLVFFIGGLGILLSALRPGFLASGRLIALWPDRALLSLSRLLSLAILLLDLSRLFGLTVLLLDLSRLLSLTVLIFDQSCPFGLSILLLDLSRLLGLSRLLLCLNGLFDLSALLLCLPCLFRLSILLLDLSHLLDLAQRSLLIVLRKSFRHRLVRFRSIDRWSRHCVGLVVAHVGSYCGRILEQSDVTVFFARLA